MVNREPIELMAEELERANRKIESLESHLRDINTLYIKALDKINEVQDKSLIAQ